MTAHFLISDKRCEVHLKQDDLEYAIVSISFTIICQFPDLRAIFVNFRCFHVSKSNPFEIDFCKPFLNCKLKCFIENSQLLNVLKRVEILLYIINSSIYNLVSS